MRKLKYQKSIYKAFALENMILMCVKNNNNVNIRILNKALAITVVIKKLSK